MNQMQRQSSNTMGCIVAGDLACASMECSGTAVKPAVSPGHCGLQAYGRWADRSRALQLWVLRVEGWDYSTFQKPEFMSSGIQNGALGCSEL